MSSRRRRSWTPSAEGRAGDPGPAADAGFTLAEVLAALALLSALGLVVASGFISGGRGLQRASEATRRNAEILRLDEVVRSCAQRVLTPYWLSAPQASPAPGSLAISYLDGSPGAALRLVFKDGTLTIGDGNENVSFCEVRDAKMEIAPARERGTAVLRLTVFFEGLEPFTILAAFGGKPFPLAAPP